MHYRNGRPAQNGDKVVLLPPNFTTPIVGILYDAAPDNDYCNGKIAPIGVIEITPNLKECLHIEDVLAVLATDGRLQTVMDVPAPSTIPVATADLEAS